MPWSSTITTLHVVAIHAALLPTDNGDGQIILFGDDDHYMNWRPESGDPRGEKCYMIPSLVCGEGRVGER
jgi:hypothetical protein